jgi:nucleoside 2-deoxyribosyltransferase
LKRIYVCGSLRFTREIEEVEHRLEEKKIEHEASKRKNSRGVISCLERIDYADVVYVVNPDGYIGKSVAFDLGYAYAKDKPIYVMHAVDDPPVMGLIGGVLSPEELVELIKKEPSASREHSPRSYN